MRLKIYSPVGRTGTHRPSCWRTFARTVLVYILHHRLFLQSAVVRPGLCPRQASSRPPRHRTYRQTWLLEYYYMKVAIIVHLPNIMVLLNIYSVWYQKEKWYKFLWYKLYINAEKKGEEDREWWGKINHKP